MRDISDRAAKNNTMPSTALLSLPNFPFEVGPYGTPTLAYDVLRMSAPVCQVLVPSGLKVWLITRYEDVCTVHRDIMFSRDEAVRTGAALVKDAGMEVEEGVLQNTDGDRHTRLHRVFASHYSQDHVSSWANIIRSEALKAIDGLKPDKVFDLRSNFFEPVASRSAETIFGFPVSANYRLLEHFFEASMLFDLRKRIVSSLRDGVRPAKGSYLGILNSARSEGLISESELVMNLIVFMIATLEAIAAPFLGGIFALLRDRDQWNICLREPWLLPNAVDEMLRCYPNGDGIFLRIAMKNIVLSGVEIRRGDAVLAPVSAANVDPAVFPEPRRYDARRQNSNKHVAFNVGRHHCMGSLFAKVWMRTALETLLDRLPSLRLAVAPTSITYRPVRFISIMERLPVTY
jgi:cytochrome P450